ncbi:MAG: hypothetical protein OEX02_18875 [Cyclobacteriaceae bacterium]|nr:hypothetical protein [Cyclobacteriaceae bacterium]
MDGKRVATEYISGKADGRFVDVEYPLPHELFESRATILVEFKPYDGHRAGPVFTLRAVVKK